MQGITVNGEPRGWSGPGSLTALLGELGLDPTKVAVERNLEIVPRSTYATVLVLPGDSLEIVHFVGGGDHVAQPDDDWSVAGRRFRSRLIVGTGKYRDFEQTREAIATSGAEIVTVAVRRVNIANPGQPMLTDYLDPKVYTYLPNTAGCYTAADAVRTLRLAREAARRRPGRARPARAAGRVDPRGPTVDGGERLRDAGLQAQVQAQGGGLRRLGESP